MSELTAWVKRHHLPPETEDEVLGILKADGPDMAMAYMAACTFKIPMPDPLKNILGPLPASVMRFQI